jgi:catechol 2,3-dioxygenase-like lactoylglutathione lyase family enzyme
MAREQEDSMATQTASGVKTGGATLASSDAIATIAVKDVEKARTFYESTLGFKLVEAEEGEVVTFASGDSRLFVYRSEYAGSNKATAATWIVGDVDETVAGLRKKGVTFEHYDLPGMKREGDVHVAGDMRAAWFKDPDGNILALVSG